MEWELQVDYKAALACLRLLACSRMLSRLGSHTLHLNLPVMIRPSRP